MGTLLILDELNAAKKMNEKIEAERNDNESQQRQRPTNKKTDKTSGIWKRVWKQRPRAITCTTPRGRAGSGLSAPRTPLPGAYGRLLG